MKPPEVTEQLKLNELRNKVWFVVPSCATTGEGLMEGLVRFLFLHAMHQLHVADDLVTMLTLRLRLGFRKQLKEDPLHKRNNSAVDYTTQNA